MPEADVADIFTLFNGFTLAGLSPLNLMYRADQKRTYVVGDNHVAIRQLTDADDPASPLQQRRQFRLRQAVRHIVITGRNRPGNLQVIIAAAETHIVIKDTAVHPVGYPLRGVQLAGDEDGDFAQVAEGERLGEIQKRRVPAVAVKGSGRGRTGKAEIMPGNPVSERDKYHQQHNSGTIKKTVFFIHQRFQA